MGKIPTKYYEVNPWKIIEKGFNKERGEVSESIFSLSNEYMGIRGYFEEDYSGKKLIGTYFNGIYELPQVQSNPQYKGISNKSHFMVNSPNLLKLNIVIDGVTIDLAKVDFLDFYREIDMKSGLLTRSFIYDNNGIRTKLVFKRLLDMINYHDSYQVLEIEPLDSNVNVKILSTIDYNTFQWGDQYFWNLNEYQMNNLSSISVGSTKKTHQLLTTIAKINLSDSVDVKKYIDDKEIGYVLEFNLSKEKTFTFIKEIKNSNDRTIRDETTFKQELTRIREKIANVKVDNLIGFYKALESNIAYFKRVWDKYDIEIDGDELNQQGIRFCIFNLVQTYQGLGMNHNIGAKGLTGEAYSGNAFWDTETYCLPFYILNNPKSARDLLMFRYNTLDNARARAKDLDCLGACYPIATCNGDEACALWQHASLQFQPTSAVSYAIDHYVKNTLDYDFLFDYGVEMSFECARCLASRGDWNSAHTKFGLYCVMGPDEFQMMVNHNTYTNFMAKKTIEFALSSLDLLKEKDNVKYIKLINKLEIKDEEINDLREKADKMLILYDKNTLLFEQHEGYFNLPHVDISKIPVTDFPLYSHWSYDRIYRNDMIKQPDVLMFMFLYPQDFSIDEIRANYEFYEPRTIHESSLSPSIHSIFAMELGRYKEAVDFFAFATRMDLDDYNRNTLEGLHTTSIAAAWVNIVYGFGGLRSDREMLVINPHIPDIWTRYSFHFMRGNSNCKVECTKENVIITVTNPITLKLYGDVVTIKDKLIVKTR